MFRFLPKRFSFFIALIAGSIIVIYYLPEIFNFFWFVLVLIWYYRSSDEPLWLAFFWVTTDGFLSFFGLYEASVQIIPGMPAIEVAQLYILLTLFKTNKYRQGYYVFYNGYLKVLLFYLILLIILGIIYGIEGGLNVYFRIFKETLPFLLFYTLPKLLNSEVHFERFFHFIFPVVVLALVTQVSHIVFGLPISSLLGAKQLGLAEVTDSFTFRGFYNTHITLIGYFGALYYSAEKHKKFSPLYLNIVIYSALLMAILSATRGWIIGFLLTLVLHYVFILKIKPAKILKTLFVGGILFIVLLQIPVIKTQINNSLERTSTVVGMIEGDEEALATQQRTSNRSPKVIQSWLERPILGWGFSSHGKADAHVANQAILAFSGIVGFFLLNGFLFYAIFRLYKAGRYAYNNQNLTFVFFFLGWFFIHSTSAQQFAYYGLPKGIIAITLFFSFAAFHYQKQILLWKRRQK